MRLPLALAFVASLAGAALATAASSPAAPVDRGSARAVDAGARPSPRFGLPIRCTLGKDCFLQNYVDRDLGPGWRDYACGALSYDGHHGTDFRLPSLAEMEAGVEVVAAAAGRVVAARDGEPDRSVRERGRESLQGRDAGNGVRIAHGRGWETQYSHLKRGSVRVRPGQRIEAGTVLGLVGLSGNTEFPHLDFVVRRDGHPLDPFDPLPSTAPGAGACPSGPTAATLWHPDVAGALRYRSSGVLIAGFAAGAVDRAKAQRDEYRDLPDANAAALVFYVEVFGVREGDVERIELVAPDGTALVSAKNAVERNLAVRFAYAGKKRVAPRWPDGTYVARYALVRAGRTVAETRRALVIR